MSTERMEYRIVASDRSTDHNSRFPGHAEAPLTTIHVSGAPTFLSDPLDSPLVICLQQIRDRFCGVDQVNRSAGAERVTAWSRIVLSASGTFLLSTS